MTITRKFLILFAIVFAAWLLFGRAGGDSPFHDCLVATKAADEQHQIANPQPTAFQRCQNAR